MSTIGTEGEGQSRHYLWIRNAEKDPIVLCVEPWANEIPLSHGSDYLICFEGPDGEFPAVEWRKDRVTVYGWSGSMVWVFLDGQVVLSCEQKVPPIPRRL